MRETDKPKTSQKLNTWLSRRVTRTINVIGTQFLFILIMDFLARTGYQMGKSPVLPLFAESLGAGPEVSGTIVAVSTITGLITSPLIGTLSDLYGRRRLLIYGTLIFAFTPFMYLFIQNPGQLLVARLIHGFSTAIYGPVMAALVADLYTKRRAERMGWYRSIRNTSYLFGPLLGGFVLFYSNFRVAWIFVGLMGLLALVPAIFFIEKDITTNGKRDNIGDSIKLSQRILRPFRNPTLISLGLVEATLFLGLRANKAFLPLFGNLVGINAAQIGIIFSLQIATTLFTQPICGRLTDKFGPKPFIFSGLLLVSIGLPLMFFTHNYLMLILLSIFLGLGEAAVMPSIITLGTKLSNNDEYGTTLGMLDAMDNVGKAVGPIIAGLLVGLFSYEVSFIIIAGYIVLIAIIFVLLPIL